MRVSVQSTLKVLLACIATFSTQICSGYKYVQVGIDSNFLVDTGRVWFVQADGSLTVLALETGQVLRRDTSKDYSGTLVRVPEGILVLNYGTITMLDAKTLAPLWHTTFHYEPNVIGDALVSYDGYGLVQCRSLSDGKIRWSYELPGALDVVVVEGMVLIHRSDTVENESMAKTVLLDVKSGNELVGKILPLAYPDHKSTQEKRFPRLKDNRTQTNGTLVTYETEYDLEEGLSLIERTRDPFDENGNVVAMGPEFELRSPTAHWTGTLPYLNESGRVTAMIKANGKILLGSNLGHVECINAETGESLWLYVFPTMHHTMSFSSPYGLPPMMSQAAAIYRRENSTTPKAGLQLRGGRASAPRIIRDPKPTNPFRRLPLYLAVAWAGAVIPFFGWVALHLYRRTGPRSSDVLGAVSVVLTLLPFCCFIFYGRVSPGSFIALGVTILAGLTLGFLEAIKCYRCGKRGWATVVALSFALLAFWILPFFLPL